MHNRTPKQGAQHSPSTGAFAKTASVSFVRPLRLVSAPSVFLPNQTSGREHIVSGTRARYALLWVPSAVGPVVLRISLWVSQSVPRSRAWICCGHCVVVIPPEAWLWAAWFSWAWAKGGLNRVAQYNEWRASGYSASQLAMGRHPLRPRNPIGAAKTGYHKRRQRKAHTEDCSPVRLLLRAR